MIKYVRIDFTQSREQSFSHIVKGKTFKVYIKYDILFNRYYLDLDIYKDGSFKPLVRDINLTTGVNLFLPYIGYGTGNLYLIPTKRDSYDKLPTASTIISDFYLLWEYKD